MKDVVVNVKVGTLPKTTNELDILILTTTGVKPMKTYSDLKSILADYPDTGSNHHRAYSKAAALFNQSETTIAASLINTVRIAGVAAPTGTDDEEKAQSVIAAIEELRTKCDDWYVLITDLDGVDYVKALSAWAESTEPDETALAGGAADNRKMYFGQTDDKTFAGAHRRAVIMFTDDLTEEADAAYIGNVGPFYPTSVTWKFKRPAGLSVPDIDDTERDALEDAHINFMTDEYKKVYVKNGVCSDGEYIDVQMGADHIVKVMRARLYDIYLINPKIPYTDEGFALVSSAVFAALNEATSLGIVERSASNGAGIFTVIIPKVVDATDEMTFKRVMPPITWTAKLEGAVQSVTVSGKLLATLA